MSLNLWVTNTDEWRGSMTLAAAFIIEDVLSDGEPFLAKTTVELESGGTGTMVSSIQSITAGRVKFKQGGRVGYFNLTDLLSLEVI